MIVSDVKLIASGLVDNLKLIWSVLQKSSDNISKVLELLKYNRQQL